ncbi:MAG: S8 family serine peptidase [Flavobacteriaceae bacterium]|nr:S8 family serine peptidase [Flavobacteriaceae bacterium]
MKKELLLIAVFALHFCGMAQVEDAWVFFTDKENVVSSLANPISILTQDAIDRKANHGVSIDERDVPVNEAYITQVKNETGISVWAKSKWFNAIHVRGTIDDINALLDLNFVDNVEFANRDLNTNREMNPIEDKFAIENTRVDFNYGNTLNQVEMLNLQSLHEQDYTGSGVVIAVMDSGFPGVNTISPFQRMRDAGNLMGGYDFVDQTADVYAFSSSDHGTKVLSTMGGFIQDQFVGTAPDATYYLFRTEDVFSETPVEESYWVEAAERADSLGVDVINTSLGYKGYDNPNYSYSSADMDGQTAFITRGADIAAEKGIFLVNSAGNSGTNGVNAPADAAGVFSIGAVDSAGNYASFSSQGSLVQPVHKPDVMARGAASYVINFAGNMTQNNGTSFSSPIMAGAVACLMQALPNIEVNTLKDAIRESASQFSSPDFMMGYGIPDFGEALTIGLSLAEVTDLEFRAWPNPVDEILYFNLPAEVESVQVRIFDVLGKLVLDTSILNNQPYADLRSLSSGIYMAQIQYSAANKTIKLIKN